MGSGPLSLQARLIVTPCATSQQADLGGEAQLAVQPPSLLQLGGRVLVALNQLQPPLLGRGGGSRQDTGCTSGRIAAKLQGGCRANSGGAPDLSCPLLFRSNPHGRHACVPTAPPLPPPRVRTFCRCRYRAWMALLFMRESSAGGAGLPATALPAAAAAAAGTSCASASGGGGSVVGAGTAAAAPAATAAAVPGARCRANGGRLSALSAAEVDGAVAGAALGCGVPPATAEEAGAASAGCITWIAGCGKLAAAAASAWLAVRSWLAGGAAAAGAAGAAGAGKAAAASAPVLPVDGVEHMRSTRSRSGMPSLPSGMKPAAMARRSAACAPGGSAAMAAA